jgi:hypothetical protein
VATKSQLLPHGVEKVLAAPPALVGDAATLGALLRALAAAAAWADDRANSASLARMLAAPEYLDVPAELIEDALLGRLALGDGERLDDPDFLYFGRYDGGAPRAEEALWLYAQMVRWGHLPASEASRRTATRVFRPDLYRTHLGAPPAAVVPEPFDGVPFDPENVDAYLQGLTIHTPFVAAPRMENG